MNSDNLIKPAFDNNNIPVVFSSDNGYALYLGVCIKSLIANSTPENNYDILILDGGIEQRIKNLILKFQQNNVSIRFIDISPYLKNYDLSLFALNFHFTLATYYRFFLPLIFHNYSKVLYLDCVTVILNDVAELYKIDIGDNYIGATRDIAIIHAGENYPSSIKYYYDVLKLENHKDYFQAGCMICNIEQMKKDNLTEKLIEKLIEVKTPQFVDQCILNSVCQKRIKFISQNWNYTWHISIMNKVYEPDIPEPYLTQFKAAQSNPYILHFTAKGIKPWLNPALDKAHYFWKYARMTPFYEEIIYNNFQVVQSQLIAKSVLHTNFFVISDAINYTANKLKYWRYKLLSKITFGKKRKKYKQKRKDLKARLKQVRVLLKGK